MSDPVLLEIADHVAILTLNQPERRNSLTPDLLECFRRAVEDVAGREDVRAVVVTGAGRSFSAGADFTTMPSLAEATGLDGTLAIHGAIEALYRFLIPLGELEVPTIAAVNGAAVGGGLGLALLCDIRFVAEEAKVGANFARLGIHPGLGITELLLDAIGYQAAADLLLSGRIIRGREAAALGLFRKALPNDEVLPAAKSLASEIAQAAPLAVRWIKRSLRSCAGWDLAATRRSEAFAQSLLASSSDAREGIQAMLEKREPRFQGA